MYKIASSSSFFKTSTLSLISFSLIVFVTSFGDAIMSFMSPNIIQDHMNDEFLMGIILSLSSMVGYVVDVVLGTFVKEKSFFIYLIFGIIIALLFPVMMGVAPSMLMFFLGMASWGIYYELFSFSKSNYVHRCLPHDKHDLGWAALGAFGSIAYLLGPILAVFMQQLNNKLPLFLAFFIQLAAFVGALIYRFVFRYYIKDPIVHSQTAAHKPHFSLWWLYQKKLWPILLFVLSLWLIDSAFWTIGALLVESKQEEYPLSSFLYTAYLLPALLMSPLGVKLGKKFGKKRTSFIAGLLSGLIYIMTWFIYDFNWFLYAVGAGSIALAIATPEIHGAIEDYCERLGESSNSLVGLVNSMGSVAYIIGPILSGFIASKVGDQKALAVIGGSLFVVSAMCLIVVPRKIRMPQKTIQALYEIS